MRTGLTGILRVAKESIFSGLNNLAVYSLLRPEFSTCFGFTKPEVAQLLLEGGTGDIAELTRALLEGDAEALEEQLHAFTTNLISYHDTRLRPEQVYHAFIIGLLATLEPDYLVRSNRESGSGRPDVVIRPRLPGRPGVILELKVAKPGKKAPKQALAEGLAQIRAGDYGAELRAAGAAPVHAFAVAFDSKRVSVRSSEA